MNPVHTCSVRADPEVETVLSLVCYLTDIIYLSTLCANCYEQSAISVEPASQYQNNSQLAAGS